MWATARPKREGRKMRERPEPACSVPDLAHLQQAFLRRKVASKSSPFGVAMRLPFCIFKMRDDGSVYFVEEAQTLDAAKAHVQALAGLWLGEYVIYVESTGEWVTTIAGKEES
jgi:hypothetical protein